MKLKTQAEFIAADLYFIYGWKFGVEAHGRAA